MTILNYFDHHDKKASKEHFLHLVQVASADGVVENSEIKLLHRIGQKLGFTDPEIDSLLQSKERGIFTPPYELEKRFHQIYDIVAMALADGVIYQNEMNVIKRFIIASNFKEEEVEKLINLLSNGIKYGKSEEDLFDTYKQKK